MKFIKLRCAGDPSIPIWINPQHIVAMVRVKYQSDNERTTLYMFSNIRPSEKASLELQVFETPAQIKAMASKRAVRYRD